MYEIYVVLVHGEDDAPPRVNSAFFTLKAAQAQAQDLAESKRDEAAADSGESVNFRPAFDGLSFYVGTHEGETVAIVEVQSAWLE